ncbi:hypothetical protein NBT05_13300 [Aquimarina sp. ERC-38]|uniref:hypothetical protein n=1 Tax=Aquimarina sp. ERC-38 TaxID=2949996 RepID=UPI0022481930|nr:hypothetical protein [Aquimarina sp. ERC-38]UZO79921.1 hypothetical protein NBT05_13300 [Aquimarina sp. ERC-38]
MNTRTFTKYATYIVAVLSATLINQYILKFISKYIHVDGYFLVLADMALVVLIFAPAFAVVSGITKKASKVYIKTSKKVSSSSRSGVFFGFIIAFIILFILFAISRHGMDVIQDTKLYINQFILN